MSRLAVLSGQSVRLSILSQGQSILKYAGTYSRQASTTPTPSFGVGKLPGYLAVHVSWMASPIRYSTRVPSGLVTLA